MSLSHSQTPSVPLHNAAVEGTKMPIIGIGTGGYGAPGNRSGEHWDNSVAEEAVRTWLSLGGRRIDTANDYGTQVGIASAIKSSGIPREELFITSKLGPTFPLGYDEVKEQFATILRELQVTYVDLILIHWPGVAPPSSVNWTCFQNQNGSFKYCRQESWRALVEIFKAGQAKAIGVSNFEQNHLQDIFEMNTLIPAVNQIEFHPYWHEFDLVKYCQDKQITFNSYSPLGAPDHMSSIDNKERWAVQVIDQPLIMDIAKKYSKTPAQVVLRWAFQQNIVMNPRTMNPIHMKENLDIFNFTLTQADINTISNVPKPAKNPKVCQDPHLIP